MSNRRPQTATMEGVHVPARVTSPVSDARPSNDKKTILANAAGEAAEDAAPGEAAEGLARLVTLMARQAARREFRRHRGRSLLGIAIILTLLTATLIGATLLYHYLIQAH